MRVTIEKVNSIEEEQALVKVASLNDTITRAIGLLENGEGQILCYDEDEVVPVPVSKIYYIESVDEKCFVYLKESCLSCRYRLYELEELLDFRFFRCSKSMICNVKKIRSVKTVENARMMATLINEESILISRSYVKELKRRLGLA